jgi:6-phosphofructokinase 1
LRGTDFVRVPIAEGVAELKTVDTRLYEAAAVFFG